MPFISGQAAKDGITAAMQRDIDEADLTVHETAIRLRLSEADDDAEGKKALALLYKALHCTKKYPHWLWGAWCRVTKGTNAISELCRQCGGVFLALPDMKAADDKSLVRCISEFADLTTKVADARLGTSRAGMAIAAEEAEAIERAAHDTIRAICELTHRFNASAGRESRTFAASLQEAALMQNTGAMT